MDGISFVDMKTYQILQNTENGKNETSNIIINLEASKTEYMHAGRLL